MNNQVFWIFEMAIAEGRYEDFLNVMKELVEATNRNEAQTLAYEWLISEDRKICHIHERYSDSTAVLVHLSTFIEKYAARLMDTGAATKFIVYGEPSSEARKVLDSFGAVYMTPIGGFHR